MHPDASQRTWSRRRLVALPLAAATGRSFAAGEEIIDSHAQVWKYDRRFPWVKGIRQPANDATAEALIETMKKNLVSRAVLVQSPYYGWDHSFLADVVKQHPDSFRAVAQVNPEDPSSPDQLSRLVQQGFRGVRLAPSGDARGDWIRGPLMAPLWRRARQLGIPISITCSTARLADVQKLCEKFPDATVVIDHMADAPLDQPAELDKLVALKRYPRVYVKLTHIWSVSKTGFPFRDVVPYVKRIYAGFTGQRLLFGSDWPAVNQVASYTLALAWVRELPFLRRLERPLVLGMTAAQLWQFNLRRPAGN